MNQALCRNERPYTPNNPVRAQKRMLENRIAFATARGDCDISRPGGNDSVNGFERHPVPDFLGISDVGTRQNV